MTGQTDDMAEALSEVRSSLSADVFFYRGEMRREGYYLVPERRVSLENRMLSLFSRLTAANRILRSGLEGLYGTTIRTAAFVFSFQRSVRAPVHCLL